MTEYDASDEKNSIGAEEMSLENPPTVGLRALLALSATSIGIIYGDIGTSCLYVFNAIFPSSGPAPSEEDVIGALSAIIWAITIIPLIKYAIFALEFGTKNGHEGGPFAVYTSIYPPPEETDENRALTTYDTLTPSTKHQSFLDRKSIKSILFTWALFGTCLTMGDGILTPAVSVVSAVEGIAVAVPSVSNSVVPISVGIIVVLFILQASGTHRVGFLFAPIVSLWLITVAIAGIINLTAHPGVFRAFDPSRAVMLFVRTGNYDLLSGVLLAITGVEALFANLGQFSKTSIRMSFMGFVYPCLLFAYLGQAAQLITNGDAVITNVFFQSVPGGVSQPFWWFSFILAVLAAIIASQAMISATFSLVQQLTRLHAIPSLKIVHTNEKYRGQVFVPSVNVLLMIGTIALTAAFGTSSNLTNAYGFAVAGVLIVTTSMLSIAIVRVKKLPIYAAVAFFVFFCFFDGLFWGSSLKKVPEGAWVPLGLAGILLILLQTYSWARGLENDFDSSHRHRLQDIIGQDEKFTAETEETGINMEMIPTLNKELTERKSSYETSLRLVHGSSLLTRIPVFALFHNPSAGTLNGAPHSFSSFLKCYPTLPQCCVFFNIRVVGIPHTSTDQRFIVSRIRSFEGIYTATLRLGYRDPIDLSNIAAPIRDRIVAIEARSGENEKEVASRIKLIDAAIAQSVTHILPNFYVSVDQTKGNRWIRYIKTFFIESIYRRIKVNFEETDSFHFGEGENSVLRMKVSAKL